jgi:aspartyl protease family protein
MGRYRFLIGIALVAAILLGVWELSRLFPNSIGDSMSEAYFTRALLILILVASGVISSRRFGLKESARNIAIWIGIAAVLLIGYSYYPDIEEVLGNVRAELVPGYPVNTTAGEMAFAKDRNGDFLIIGAANGEPVKFLVDTGASDIVLSPDDARRIGIDTSNLAFDRTYETANGEGRGAAYTLDELQIGDMKLFNVPVSINRAKMHNSLLGMTFLSRMKSFEFREHKLYLRWR